MNTLNRSPIRITLVHALVVLLALSGVVLVPLTTAAGERLERPVGSTDLIRKHAELRGTAIFAAIAVALMAIVVWWREHPTTVAPDSRTLARYHAPAPAGITMQTKQTVGRRTWWRQASKTVTRWIAEAAVLVAGAAVYDTYRIGDSGAKASWDGNVSSAPYHAG